MKKIILILLVSVMALSCKAQVININAVLRANKSSGSWVIEYDSTGLGSWRAMPSKGYVDGIAGTDVGAALRLKLNISDTSSMLNNYAKLSALLDHINNTSNPHNVTKAQVGLPNVDNTSDVNKPVSTATQSALNGKVDNTRQVNGHALTSDVSLTKTDVGLANVDNTSDVNKPVSTAQQNALNTKVDKVTGKGLSTNDYDNAAVATVAAASAHIANTSNPHNVTKAQVGLGSVPNVDATNAANITSGTLPDARQSTNVTMQGNAFNAANKLVQLRSDGKLPALDGSLLTGISGGGGGSVVNGNIPIVIVTQHGVRNDSTTNCLPIMQRLADSLGAAGGGTLYQPNGKYRWYDTASPASWDHAIFTIAYSNVHWIGETEDGVINYFQGPNGTSPMTNWWHLPYATNYSAVCRGYSVRIQKRAEDGIPLTGVMIADMTFDGGCPPTYHNSPIPADSATGDGWDVTHKAIYVQSEYSSYTDDMTFIRVHIKQYKGEMIFGDVRNKGMHIYNCEVEHGNASLISTLGRMDIRATYMHHSANAGVETYPGPYASNINGNLIDSTTYGIVWGGAFDSSFVETRGTEISGNYVKTCTQGGLMLTRQIFNVNSHDNYYVDDNPGIRIEPQANFIVSNITIHNDHIQSDSMDVPQGIAINGNANSLKDVSIDHNYFEQTGKARLLNKHILFPFYYYGGGIDGGVYFTGNKVESVRYPARGASVTTNPCFFGNTYLNQTDLTYVLTAISTPGQAIDPQSDLVVLDGPSSTVTNFTILTNQVDKSILRVENYGTSAFLMIQSSDSHFKIPNDIILGLHDYVTLRFNGLAGKWEYVESNVVRPKLTGTLIGLIPSPSAGLTVYNTSTNKLQVYNGSAFIDTY